MHGAAGAVRLEECQYKGRNTLVGAEQKWQLKDVSLVSLCSLKGYVSLLKTNICCLVFNQNQLIFIPALNKCLSARQEHPFLATCNPTDRYQLWVFS